MTKPTGKRVGNPDWRVKSRPKPVIPFARQRLADVAKALASELEKCDFRECGNASPDARARFDRIIAMSARLEIAIDEWLET